MKTTWSVMAVAAVGAGAWWWLSAEGPSVAAQTPPTPAKAGLSAVMREKLDAAALVLEGICTEDDRAILRGAETLSETMSKPELLEILTDADYREFHRSFRNTARRLAEAARNKNFDQATLRYVEATLACVECHNHVRAKKQ